MAQESKRGCGYRKVGAMYLCGGFTFVPCDRLPYLLDTCPVCGGGVKVSRGFTQINPFALFGIHKGCRDKEMENCYMCFPRPDPAYIMGVGEGFYPNPKAFMDEALEMGISKRIPWLPKELRLGETIIYLAHPKACTVTVHHGQRTMPLVGHGEHEQPWLIEAEEVQDRPGIFSAFIPQRVEKLIWKSQATEEVLNALAERNIAPVIIEDGDIDHMSKKAKAKVAEEEKNGNDPEEGL